MGPFISRRKAILLGGLYVTQFMGLSFVFGAVPAILRSSGASLDTIAWFMLFGSIWALKMFWAPLVDRFGSSRHGHYRSWLIVLQSLLAVVMVIAGFFDPGTHIEWLAACVCVMSFIGATQDLAADGLAVIVLSDKDRGMGNGIQTSGGFIGNLIGSGVALIAYDTIGWTATMWLLAAATCLPLISVIGYREPERASYAKGEVVGFVALISFFRRGGMLGWLPVLVLVRAGIGAPHALVTPLLVDKGWTLTEIALGISMAGAVFGILGALAAGALLRRYARKPVFLAALAFGCVMLVGLWLFFVSSRSDLFILVLYGVYQMSYAAILTAQLTSMMDKCAPVTASTDFSVQYCISLLSALAVAAALLPLAQRVGYETAILVCLVILCAATLAVFCKSGFLTPSQYKPLPTRVSD